MGSYKSDEKVRVEEEGDIHLKEGGKKMGTAGPVRCVLNSVIPTIESYFIQLFLLFSQDF